MIALKPFTTKELENSLRGYEELITLLSKEIERLDGYNNSTPYTDVLLAERDYMVQDCYTPLVKEVSTRKKGKVEQKITGKIPYDEEKVKAFANKVRPEIKEEVKQEEPVELPFDLPPELVEKIEVKEVEVIEESAQSNKE